MKVIVDRISRRNEKKKRNLITLRDYVHMEIDTNNIDTYRKHSKRILLIAKPLLEKPFKSISLSNISYFIRHFNTDEIFFSFLNLLSVQRTFFTLRMQWSHSAEETFI